MVAGRNGGTGCALGGGWGRGLVDWVSGGVGRRDALFGVGGRVGGGVCRGFGWWGGVGSGGGELPLVRGQRRRRFRVCVEERRVARVLGRQLLRGDESAVGDRLHRGQRRRRVRVCVEERRVARVLGRQQLRGVESAVGDRLHRGQRRRRVRVCVGERRVARVLGRQRPGSRVRRRGPASPRSAPAPGSRVR